jgi:hypothetical protein
MARAWRMCENDAFAAIHFWLGWNCQSFGEGGVLHLRREAPRAGAGPILFAATKRRKGWGLSAGGTEKNCRTPRHGDAKKTKPREKKISLRVAARRTRSFFRFRGAWGSFQIADGVVAMRGPSIRPSWISNARTCRKIGPFDGAQALRRCSGQALCSNSGQECIIPLLYLHAWNIPDPYVARNGLRWPCWG